MRISKSLELRKSIDKSLIICDALESIGKESVARELHTLIDSAVEEKFIIGVIGSAKRGKSTLINGLLGQSNDKLAPIGKFPATNVTTIFTSSDKKEIKVKYESGKEEEINESEIKQYACEEHNPENKKGVKTIHVAMPFANLEKGVYVVDTPGANNALDAQHSDILFKFLPQAHALIFLLSSDDPIVESEQKILEAIKGNDVKKVFFALNKIDRLDSGDVDEQELEECLEHNRKVLSSTSFDNPKIYRISAKNYFEKGEDSGTESLIADMRKMFEADIGGMLAEQLAERSSRLLSSVKDEVRNDLELMKLSVEDVEKTQKEQKRLIRELQDSKRERELAFSTSWDEALEECEKSALQAKNKLKEKYTAIIQEKNSFQVTQLGSAFYSEVQADFGATLQPILQKCDEKVKDAQSVLIGSVQKSLGQIDLDKPEEDEKGAIILRPLRNVSSAVPSLVTGAVAYAAPAVASSVLGLIPLVGGFAGWAVGGLLSLFVWPIYMGALPFAAYRAYNQFKNSSVKGKEDLTLSVSEMIEEAYKKTLEQIKKLRSSDKAILAEFNRTLTQSIQEVEDKISNLLKNRPSPEAISKLEKCQNILEKIEGGKNNNKTESKNSLNF